MSKEKVFIVLSHKHSLKKDAKTGKCVAGEWEVTETVEFVNELRKRHTNMSTAIGDYINLKMLSGTRVGMGDYNQFDAYIRKKYPKQMTELDAAYGRSQKVEETVETSTDLITDEFGNSRPKTVFDTV